MRHLAPLYAALICLAGALPAGAGQSCIAHDVAVAELQSAIDVAGKVENTLERSDSNFALIARVGNDISKYGLKYTHVGFAKKRARDGAWVVVHQLNPCASAYSGLFVQGLGTFMLDDLYTHDILLVTLKSPLDENLETVFSADAPRRLYDPQYSMISYPGTPARYQNSNEWLLELLALAQAQAEDIDLHTRDDAHRYYLENGYKGSVIHISPLRRAFARLAARNVRFDDHPPSSHRTGLYETVSVKSVLHYLQQTGDVEDVITIAGTYRRPVQIPETVEKKTSGD